ncbi:MAG: hypothetical protein PHN56_06440, partial [Candidatus Nanoarchaeia archaeon]|nr:hypothetical protein [Candidatus Nanoarchaeia archaeon]
MAKNRLTPTNPNDESSSNEKTAIGPTQTQQNITTEPVNYESEFKTINTQTNQLSEWKKILEAEKKQSEMWNDLLIKLNIKGVAAGSYGDGAVAKFRESLDQMKESLKKVQE